MPPKPTMQNGVRVTSTRRTGSQKPIDRPMRGGLLQKQTGVDGLPMSSCPSERSEAEPIVSGNTQLRYKDAMNQLESTSPGTKAQFFLGYLDRAAPLFATQDDVELVGCERCGQPTTGRFCAFCRAKAQILGERLEEPRGGDDARATTEELSNEVMPVEIYGANR